MQQHAFLLHLAIIQKVMATAILVVGLSGCASCPSETEARNGYFASHAFKATGQNERVRFLVIHYTA